MSQAPDMKPFRQIPTWEANDKFEIQGSELEALYNYFNIVAPSFTAIQQVFARGIQSNKIKLNYEYEDGTPVSDDEVKAYTEKLNAFFEEKLKNEKNQVSQDTETSDAPVAKILNMHGVTAEQEG
jgi:hypothetical protein